MFVAGLSKHRRGPTYYALVALLDVYRTNITYWPLNIATRLDYFQQLLVGIQTVSDLEGFSCR